MLERFYNKSIIITVFVFIVAVVLQYIDIFNSFFLTEIVSPSLPLSPLSILIIIGFLDLIILRLINNSAKNRIGEPGQKTVLSTLLYLVMIVSGIGLILLIRWLYLNVNLDFEVEALFDIGGKEVFWFFIFLSLFVTYLLFSLLIYIKIEKLNITVKTRLTIVVALVVLLFVIAIVTIPFSIVIPVILSFLIYLFVLDIYVDHKSVNSTWIFTFMIIIAGFTSLIVFSAYTEDIHQKDISEVRNLIYDRDLEFESKIIGSASEPNEEYIEGDFYQERLVLDSVKFLDKLNSGFYSLGNNLYFNPVFGDYIRLDSAFQNRDKFYLNYFYCTKPGFVYSDIKTGQSYIVVHEGKVLYNNTGLTTIPVPDKIDSSKEITEYIKNGYSYIRYLKDDKTVVYKIDKIPDILRPLSLFSLFFVMIGILIFIVSVLNSKYKFLPGIIDLSFNGIRTLKDRIQFSIIGLLITSFFILGILTFHYFHNFYDENQKEKAVLFSQLLNSGLKSPDSNIDIFDIQDKLFSFERQKNINYYYYDSKGRLLKDKRRRQIYNGNVPYEYIDLKQLEEGTRNGFINTDKYMLSVIPVDLLSADKGFIVGYFDNSNSAVLAASDILSSFLNIYVLLFLLSGAIAIALANSISKPIEILGEKMEILSLNENNELLKWDNQDEIGKLISIYNQTVKKLKESAKIITKIERDSAWRDMAKQVAHEIKNPLTPLKLNIQYLQSFVERQPERASEMIKQLAPGMIEQINNLDKIATEFSDFAKMPTARNEKVNLNEIVKAVHDFFRKREDLDIQLYVPINDLIVFADKNHIVSILNNIIKNAIQAIPTDREGRIIIDLYKEKDNSVIKITDNGIGIPENMKNKVFSPNFTTKSSGTGLGLAISSSMIQSFNGRIYFDTKINAGTSFYVEIPLMRIKENYNGQKRVSLDD